MKVILIIIGILLCGCNHKNPEQVIIKIPIHDTVEIKDVTPLYAPIDSTVRILLIQYYKAGWMDGSNHTIDLHNDNSLTDKTIKLIQSKDWRKMEAVIAAKGKQ